MKKLPKAKLDEMIALTREFFESDTCEASDRALKKRIEVANEVEEEIGCSWLCLCDICSVVYRLTDGASNQDVYKVLEVLGWKVE